jgi:hypothetical protein
METNETTFTITNDIVVRGMRKDETFDPKRFLDESSKPKFYVGKKGYRFDLIQKTEPFHSVREIKLMQIFVNDAQLYKRAKNGTTKEVENNDFFRKRIALTAEEHLWLMWNLISASDNPKTENPLLLNNNEYANYLVDTETITMFQLIGGYGTARGWQCYSFLLNELTESNKSARLINKVLIPY